MHTKNGRLWWVYYGGAIKWTKHSAIADGECPSIHILHSKGTITCLDNSVGKGSSYHMLYIIWSTRAHHDLYQTIVHIYVPFLQEHWFLSQFRHSSCVPHPSALEQPDPGLRGTRCNSRNDCTWGTHSTSPSCTLGVATATLMSM